jgi:hypothetical protein
MRGVMTGGCFQVEIMAPPFGILTETVTHAATGKS